MTDHVDPRIEAAAIALFGDVESKLHAANGWDRLGLRLQNDYRTHATAVLAAADKAATITTAGALYALPSRSVVRLATAAVWEKAGRYWFRPGDESGHTMPDELRFPARVIHWGTK